MNDRKSQSHLVNIIAANKRHQPTFALFLGAGASSTSGVHTAGQMIDKWREMFCYIHGYKKQDPDFLKNQPWFGTEREYAHLFATLFDSPSQRREHIEECIIGARPSWGYIYLANLLTHNIFNCVFTTNFDDLINEACYRFSDDLRPIVCAHDSSIGMLRMSVKRPKVVKLHGDYLYDNIKNTERELESLEENTKAKFKQFAREYGLIVVGYSGRDRSVMDTIESLLKDEYNFPAGVYWCVRKGSTQLPARVEDLGRFPKVRIVEIDGFDDFFADLNSELGLSLQEELAKPYNALKKRLNNLIQFSKQDSLHFRIKEDIKRLADEIMSIGPERSLEYPLNEKAGVSVGERGGKHRKYATRKKLDELTPYVFLAEAQLLRGDWKRASELLLKNYETLEDVHALNLASRVLVKVFDASIRKSLVALISRSFRNLFLKSEDKTSFNDVGLNLISAGEQELAREVFQRLRIESERAGNKNTTSSYIINEAQTFVHSCEELPKELTASLSQLLSNDYPPTRWGASVVLGDAKAAIQNYKDMEKFSPFFAKQAESWPIWDLYASLIVNNSNGEHATTKLRNGENCESADATSSERFNDLDQATGIDANKVASKSAKRRTQKKSVKSDSGRKTQK